MMTGTAANVMPARRASLPAVLVVEDDAEVRALVSECLRLGGYETREAASGREAIGLAAEGDFDLAVVDLRLPDVTGFDLIRTLSEEGELPVLVLSGLGTAQERAAGIEAGADDYLAKPFEPRELQARVAALLRARRRATRAQIDRGRSIRVDGWLIDIKRQIAASGGRRFALSDAEFSLLRFMIEHPNRVIGRDELLAATGFTPGAGPRSVDIRVTRLRKKLEPDSADPRLIRTIRGEGYMLVADRIEYL